MSDGLQCPACDEVIEFEDAEGKRSLSQLLGAGVSTAVADHTEQMLREHLETHSIEDFVTALVMADRYIDELERERDEAVAWRTEVEQRIAQPIMRAPRPPDQDFGPPPVMPQPPGMQGNMFAAGGGRAPRRVHVDPDESLIPFVQPGQRAEGQVGRKF